MHLTRASVDLLGPDIGREDDARDWRGRAREFARDVVLPIGAALDAMDPHEVGAPGSPIRDLLAQAQREGFTRLGAPPHLGGLAASGADELLVLEELATADAALAALLVVAPAPFRWAGALGAPSLVADVALPYLAVARTDWIGCCALDGPSAAVRATPTRAGWRLAGETAAVPGAAVATHALVACAVDGRSSPGLALVPLDADGVQRLPVRDAIGLRALCRARIVPDRVHTRIDHVVPVARGTSAAHAQAAGAVVALGIGRAAYEGTLRWAREGMWAGRPACADGAPLPHLHRMYRLLDATRTLVRSTYPPQDALRLAADDDGFARHARAAEAFATEAAFEVAEAAARLCRADATPQGVPFLDGSAFDPDKLLRDARAAHHDPKETPHGPRQDA
jgi:acyl-CoA dehydrogenase